MMFVHPMRLWLLLVLVPLLAMHLGPRFPLIGLHRIVTIATRCLAMILLVLALARPVMERQDRMRTTVAVVDLSGSIGDDDLAPVQADLKRLLQQRGPDEQLRLVIFDAKAREVGFRPERGVPDLLELRRSDRSTRTTTAPATTPGSALAEAMELGGAMIRHDGAGRLVLYSDGLETAYDARAAAYHLAQRRIRVEPVVVGGPRAGEVVLRAVHMPASSSIGACVDVQAEIESGGETSGRVIARQGTEELARDVSLHSGRQRVTIPVQIRAKGLLTWSVRIDAAGDRLADNNTLDVCTQASGPYDVRVVETSDGGNATRALTQLLGEAAAITTLSPAELSTSTTWRRADVLVLADTPAGSIPDGVQSQISEAVTGGMGLLVSGGRRSFGPGGYVHNALADLLPVRAAQKIERRDPSTTLVVIIDTSGSMGGARVSLAKEIARLAISRLTPHDKVGIVEFYGAKRWAAPIQPASNAIDLQRALNRLSASGGTVILPAMEEAYYALQNVRTRTKHILVLTDGGVETGAFESLIRQMTDKGITLSTVMVGPGAHSAFLAGLAQWGRGRFYSAPDRFNLPEVIVKQPESSLLAPLVEQPTRLGSRQPQGLLKDVDLAGAPALGGYVETDLRPTADMLVSSEPGHPVLARWRHGLGGVAAFTSQLGGEWSRDFLQWPGSTRLFSNLVRSLVPASADRALRITPVARGGGIELQLENQMPARDEGGVAVELAIAQDGQQPIRRTIDPFHPDEWNLYLPQLPPGPYKVDARTVEDGLAGAAAFIAPPVREVCAAAPDRALLEDLRTISSAQRAAASTMAPTKPLELWPALTVAVWLLVLLNVLIRRWPGQAVRLSVVAGILACLAGPSERAIAAAPASMPSTTTAPSSAPDVAPLPAPLATALTEASAATDPAEAIQRLSAVEQAVLQQFGTPQPLLHHLQAMEKGPRVGWLLAHAAATAGELQPARDALRSLTQVEPARGDAWAQLARIEEMLGDDKAALSAIDAALSKNPENEASVALRVRKALILYDTSDQRATASAILEQMVKEAGGDASAGRFCGQLAALNGDYDLAVRLLLPIGHTSTDPHTHLFLGLFLLRLGRAGEARQQFEQAYSEATLVRDRRYALERIVTASRQEGTLPKLADAWLATEELSPDRLTVLLSILRELGRPGDALKLLEHPARTAEQRAIIESPDFQKEVVGVALGAGRAREAEAAYRGLLERNPQHVEWRISLARLQLLDGRRDEAVALFNEGLGRFTDPANLMLLADGARQLALDGVALDAARKAGAVGTSEHVRAVLFEADLVRQRGEPDQALRLLRQVSARPGLDDRLLQQVAESLERYGDKVEALRLFQRIYQKTKAEDTLLRIAWLLEENQRFDEAFALWKDMWQTTQVPARLKQSQERMLDLASRAGKLADLAIELEERVDGGKGGERDLALLIDIYTTANDPISAAEILQDYGRRSGRQVDVLNRLARVYLGCEQFGRCNATLRKLVELDPPNAADYLQQIAVVAVERKQPQEARAAIARLATVASGSEIADELSAGVLALIGLDEEAARSYERVLARHPDRIESLLLWSNAMRSAGRADRAVARLQMMVEDANEDDLFTIAVDGLLNLQAKPAAMTSALRRVYARLASAPQKVFLYQLAVDLLDAAARKGPMQDLLEQSVVVAGERRAALLRELMDSARSDGRTADLIRFGTSLLALGDEEPPQVFLELGEAMIKQGEVTLAERVFERAAVGGDYSAIQQRVAGYYEMANMPGDADRVIRQLLINEPDNVQLLIRSGTLSEQLGTFDRSFEQYYRAADLMLRRLPGVLAAEATSRPQTQPAADKQKARPRQAANLDEMARYFESAGNGLLNAARTPALRDRLQKDLVTRIEGELNSLAVSRQLMPTIARNPRLSALAKFLRQVAFSLGVPEVADRVDHMLLERFSEDAELREAVVQTRYAWGLFSRATAFVDAGKFSAKQPPEVAIEGLVADPTRLDEMLKGGRILPDTAARLVPMLIMTGHEDQARRVLGETPTSAVRGLGDVAAGLIAAAIALDDDAAMRRWLDYWLDGCQNLVPELFQMRTPSEAEEPVSRSLKSRNGPAVAGSLERSARLVWQRLSEQDRRLLVQRMERISGALDEKDRVPVELLRMRFCEAVGLPFGGLDALVETLAQDPDTDALLQLFPRLPADRYPGLIRKMVAARKPAAQRSFLLMVTGRLTSPPDEALMETVLELFKAAPKQRLESGRGYITVRQGNWNINRAQPELGRRLGEVLLGESPNETAILIAVAVARDTAGKHEEALPLAREALENLLAVKTPEYEHRSMLEEVIGIMHAADLDAAIADVTDRLALEQPTPMLLFAQGLLLERAGREKEACAAFAGAFKLSPNNNIFSRKLITSLRQSGRVSELAAVLSANLTRSTIMESYEWRTLTECYIDLWKPIEAARAAQKDETVLGPIECLRIARMHGRDDEARTIFRRFLATNRDDGRFYTPFWPAPSLPGGITGYVEKQRTPTWKRQRLFEALADVPFAEQEYMSLLMAARPDRRDIPGLIDGLRRATRLNGTRARWIESLLDLQQRNALTSKERQAIISLAQEDPAGIPGTLLPAIDEMLLRSDSYDSAMLTTLAQVFTAKDRPQHVRAILKWVVASDLLEGRSASRIDDRFGRLDLYLATLPPEARAAELQRQLALLAPCPADALSDSFDPAWLDRLSEAGNAAAVSEQVAAASRRLAESTSPGFYTNVRAAVARREAAAGRIPEFTAQVSAILSAQRSDLIVDSQVDPRTFLPPLQQMKSPDTIVDALNGQIREAASKRRLRQPAATRCTCLLAQWCFDNALAAKGKELVQTAEQNAGGPGEHWLWVADAARMGGDDAKAVAIETRMLEADTLPVMRVPALLLAVASAQGEDAAGRLAMHVAGYSDHPAVLERAAAWAARKGDPAAEGLRTRLQRAAPAHPTTTQAAAE